MPITAAAIYDARTRTSVAVAASPPLATPATLLSIATFTQHVDNVGASGVATTPAQVAAAWAGPPAITYAVVAARYRVLVFYTSVAGDVDAATDADAALRRLSRVVAIDAPGLAAEGSGGGDATGRVWAAVKDCLEGDELAGVPPSDGEGEEGTTSGVGGGGALIARGASVLGKLHLPGGGDRGSSGSGGGSGHALARVASLRASGSLSASAAPSGELAVTTSTAARRHSMNTRDSSDNMDGEGEADGPGVGAKDTPARGRLRGLLHGGKKKTLAALRSGGGGGAAPLRDPSQRRGSPRSSASGRAAVASDAAAAAAVAPTPRTPTTTLTVSPALWADTSVGAAPLAVATAGDLAWLAGVLRGEAPIRGGGVAPPVRHRALPAATVPSSTGGGASAAADTGELGGGGALAIAPPPAAAVAERAPPAQPVRPPPSTKREAATRVAGPTRTPAVATADAAGAPPPTATSANLPAPAPAAATAARVVAPAVVAPVVPAAVAPPPADPAAAAAAEFDAAINANDLTAAMTSITTSLRRLAALPASAPGVATTTAAAVHLATGVRLLARHDAAVAAAGPTPPRPPAVAAAAATPPHPKALEAAALAQHLAALPLGASPPLARKAARAGAASNFAVGNYGVAAALIRRLLADGPPAAAVAALRRRLDECGAAGGGDVGRVPTPGRVDWAGLGKLGGGGGGRCGWCPALYADAGRVGARCTACLRGTVVSRP